MNILIKILIVFICLSVTACTSASIKTEAGHGEFRNKDGTQRKEITIKADINNSVQLIAKAEHLTSNNGKVDDSNSLIDGNFLFVGAGLHTKSKTHERTELNALFNRDYYGLFLQNKRRVWGNVGLISGISYINKYRSYRSTTEAKIGAYWASKNINYLWTYNIRNNTREAVDDYVLFGVEKYY